MTDEERKVKINDAYNQAMQLATAEKPTYQGSYDQQIQDIYDKISNRDPFSYDMQGDPMYQQMKDRYIQGGKMAMRDTMGKAASLTGGYGSSYGQAVGQQQYDEYLQNLSAQIPELYQMAYGMYQDEGDKLQNQYGMLRDMGSEEYNRYQDQLKDWQYDTNRQYNLWQDAYNRTVNEENTAYQREQDAFKQQQQLYNNLYTLILKSGYSPSDSELQAAGMSRAQAQALAAEYQRSITPVETGGGRGGSGGSGGGSGSGSGSSYGDYTINADQLSAAVNSGDYSASTLNQWITGASNYNGAGLTFADKDYNLTKQYDGTYKYSSDVTSKAASDAINKVLASLKK